MEKPQPNAAPLPDALREIDGVRVARRAIFTAPIGQTSWWLDMLIALEAAKRLGVQTVEIAVSGTLVRPEPAEYSKSLNTYITLESLMYGGATTANAPRPSAATVTVYAVVVE